MAPRTNPIPQREADDTAHANAALARTAPQSTGLAEVDYGEDAGGGFENITQQDLAIPLFFILQSNSPIVTDNTVEGARAGLIINSVTKELTDALRFIPCHHDHKFIQWIPRNEGGGLVSVHDPDDELVKKARAAAGSTFGKLHTPRLKPDGSQSGAENDLVETFSVYGIGVKDDGSYIYGVIPFASTQIKHYKQWMTKARSVQVRGASGQRTTPPLWAHQYLLKTVNEKNQKGQWKGWDIVFAGKTAEEARLPQESELYQTAKGFRDLVMSGVATAARETAQAFEGETDGGRQPDESGTNAF